MAAGVGDEQLPQALVLRLDSRMAVILNLLVGLAGEFANGEVRSAIELRDLLHRLRGEYPNEVQRLKDSISTLVDVVPPQILDEMGLQVMSPHELRAWIARER